jgi:hypothetical protein
MSIEGLLFGLALATGVVVLIALPLLRREAPSSEQSDALIDKQRERLLLFYERILRNVRDLDEDFALGKIEASEYQRDREGMMERGVQILKALETLPEHEMIPETPVEDSAVDRAIDDAIETAIQSYRSSARNDRVRE